MFVHLWKICCEEHSVISIFKKKKVWEVLSLLSFFKKPDCWKAERTARDKSGKIQSHQGSVCSSRTCGLNHLTIWAECVSLTLWRQERPTYRIQKEKKDDLAPLEVYSLTGEKAGLNEIQKQKQEEKGYFFPSQITRINGWIVSQTQMDRFERERDHVWWQLVPSCDAPLADQWDLGVLVGWLSSLGHAWLDNGQRHSHTPLWGN